MVVERGPASFHVMAKPRGPVCNLECAYCYYRSKEHLYPGSKFRMSDEVLEQYISQYIAAQAVPQVIFAWQGGEPTLMGLDFFRRAVRLQDKHGRPGMRIHNALQTNGTTFNKDWCLFLADHGFLVGLSLDGPQHVHDTYRRDRRGRPSFDRVMEGLNSLRRYRVEFNILACVHAANVGQPIEVYRFLHDEVGARFIQFIPVVEQRLESVSVLSTTREAEPNEMVTERSVNGQAWGHFLMSVFDEWVRHDVGQVFVQIFDAALARWLGAPAGLCVFEETCGLALVLEHNGDLYSCDHFVAPQHRLGNIMDASLAALVASPQQREFGRAKRNALPMDCLQCDVRFACNGGCPKDRVARTAMGEPGLNYLCEGYGAFFRYIGPAMEWMALLVRQGRQPAEIMEVLATGTNGVCT